MADIDEVLEVWSAVLGRCVLFGFIFLFVWFGAFLGMRGLIDAQGAWFGLTAHELALVHYCGMGLVKGFVIVFFLAPWAAVRLVIARRRKHS